MLLSLRLNSFFGRDHQQDSIDASGASKHIVDEMMMAGNINKADLHRPVVGCDGVERGETQVDRNAALLLFGQSVSIDASESAYQGGLAVIDMAGSAHDNGSNGLKHTESFFRAGLQRELPRLILLQIRIVLALRDALQQRQERRIQIRFDRPQIQ